MAADERGEAVRDRAAGLDVGAPRAAGRSGRAEPAAGPPHEIALYDMDRTITRRGTYTAWLVFWAWRRSPWRLLLLPLAGLVATAEPAGLVSRKRVKEVAQRLLMGRAVPEERVRAIADLYAARVLARNVYPEAVAALEADRRAGRRLVLATASHHFYVRAIAERLGFDEVVATRSRRDGAGRLQARIEGENCYGAAKRTMVAEHFAGTLDRRTVTVRFHSDHESDLPTFDWADERFVINPSPAMRAEARRRGWPVIDWRKR